MSSFLSLEKLDENGNGVGIFEVVAQASNSWGVTVQGSNVTVSFSLDSQNFVNPVVLCQNTPLEYVDCDVELVKITSDQPFWYRIIY